MPTTEWMKKYEVMKDKLACKADLDEHFTEKISGNIVVDVLDIAGQHASEKCSVGEILGTAGFLREV